MPYKNKEDKSAYAKAHYQQNKDAYKKRARAWNEQQRRDLTKKVWDYLLSHPCVDCGEGDPVVLEFDHCFGEKRSEVRTMIVDAYSWETIEEEINKCQVRCANCHRKKTARERGQVWLLS